MIDAQRRQGRPRPRAPAAAPLRDVTLRNVTIDKADRTFVLRNVKGLRLENVVIGGQRMDAHAR